MENSELLSYINAERLRGVKDDLLKQELLAKGWTDDIIDPLFVAQGTNTSAKKEVVRLSDFDLTKIASGRINRGQFLLCLICLPLFFVTLSLATISAVTLLDIKISFVPALISLAIMVVIMFLYETSAVVRRLHDVGHSGYVALLMYVPFVGNIAAPVLIIYLLMKKGVPTENSYGVPPSQSRPLINVLLNT